VPIGVVAAVSYRREEPDARPREISKAEATAVLLDNTVPMLRAPTRSLRSIAVAIRRAKCLGGFRGEASNFVEELLRALPPSEIKAPAGLVASSNAASQATTVA
jgi:hypothetical protein